MRAMASIFGVVLLFTSAVTAEMVTERWGHSGRCRHGRSARFHVVADGGGAVARFDLGALPSSAKVRRARLLMVVRAGPGPLVRPILVQPLTAEYTGVGRPEVQEQSLSLAPPRFRSFDATEVVRRWTNGKGANHGLYVQNAAGWNRLRTCLEVTYEGKLVDPPPPVTGLKAFHRAGQVFITFNEVNCPFAGKDEVAWDDMKRTKQQVGSGQAPRVSYRVYRHTRPITAENLHEAALLDEVGQFSAFDERMIKTDWKGERIKNVRVGSARVPRVCVQPLQELPVGTGVFVRTSDKAGRFHYAVISAVDGVENTRDVNAGNSLAQPLRETIAPPEPILHHELKHIYDRPRGHRFYLLWTDPPLSNLPGFYHLGVTFPPEPAPEPAPLYVQSWWWDNGWARSGARRLMAGCISLQMETPWVLHKGIHEGCGTYKAWGQGKVQDYWVRRLRNVLPWLRKHYSIDVDRMYAMSSDWAWHHPDLFAAVNENLTMDPKRSPTGIASNRFWGEVNNPAETEWGISAWRYYDPAWYVRQHVGFELPMLFYTPNMHLGDFGTIDKPRFYRAMLDTKRAFIASWGAHVNAGWIYALKRSDPLAAFTNCSLDSDPGIGMGDGDPAGQINGYLQFDPTGGVDRPGRWEMTLWLQGPDSRGRGGAPADSCTVAVTPRRCRLFKARPEQRFTWTNTSLGDSRVVQTGATVADKWGLVTAERVVVSKGRNRLTIQQAK